MQQGHTDGKLNVLDTGRVIGIVFISAFRASRVLVALRGHLSADLGSEKPP
jgi:hypothetical protein